MIPFIAAPAAPSFDDPLHMLRACHGKILRQCDTLQKMQSHQQQHGCDEQIQQAAAGILRYFDTAGQFHHQDEEADLFPALRCAVGMDTRLLDRLLAQHVDMLAAWDALRPVLVELAAGKQAALEATLTNAFISRYTGHIAIENTELLPMAAALLTPQQRDGIGRNMAERRGAKFPDAPG